MDETNEKRVERQTPVEFFRQISDPQKIDIIRQIAESMKPESLQELINVIGRQQANAGGEVTLNISVAPEGVRMDFGKALAWFIMPKEHAVQLALLLLQASGAELQKAAAASSSPGEPPIDIKPM